MVILLLFCVIRYIIIIIITVSLIQGHINALPTLYSPIAAHLELNTIYGFISCEEALQCL